MVDTNNDVVANTTSDGSGKDITNEIEVEENEVKLFSVEELAPSSTPITIPYLEFYRTNELEYIPYISPYNVGIQSTSETEEDTSTEDEENTEDSENQDENTDSSNNS